MKVFVTGAAGFLGRATAEAAAEAGHTVMALHRPAGSLGYDGVTPVAGDLRQSGPWQAALAEAEAVIHCAAAASGDLATQLAGTVLATENLLAQLPPGLARFVHVSSFSVYDYSAPGPFGAITEASALERNPSRRDAYTQTKLLQEEMIRSHCRARGIALVVVRPGAIYGPGKDWDHGAALRSGRFDVIFAPLARMRLIHVRDCAQVLVDALTLPVEGERIVNAVGREQPTHWRFHRAAAKAGAKTGVPIPVPYAAVRALGGLARLASRLFFGGRARLPELLDPPRQQARWRGLRYPRAAEPASDAHETKLVDGIATMTKN